MKTNKEIKRDIKHLQRGTRWGVAVLVSMFLIKLLMLLRFGWGGTGLGGRGGQGGPSDGEAREEVEGLDPGFIERMRGEQVPRVPQLTLPPPVIPEFLVDQQGQQPAQAIPPLEEQGPRQRLLPQNLFIVFALNQVESQYVAARWIYNVRGELIQEGYKRDIPVGGPSDIKKEIEGYIRPDVGEVKILILGLGFNNDSWATSLLLELSKNNPDTVFHVGFKIGDIIENYSNSSYGVLTTSGAGSNHCVARFSTRRLADIREQNLRGSYRYPWHSAIVQYMHHRPHQRPYLTLYKILNDFKDYPAIGDSPNQDRDVLSLLPPMLMQLSYFTDGLFNEEGCSVATSFDTEGNRTGRNYNLSDDNLKYLLDALLGLGAKSISVEASRNFALTKESFRMTALEYAHAYRSQLRRRGR
jgi:hypothetical protein